MIKKLIILFLCPLLLLGAASVYSTKVQVALREMMDASGVFNYVTTKEIAEPSTPASGNGVFYAGTDTNPYFKGDDGVAVDLSTGAGGGAFDDTADPVVQNTTTKDVHFGAGAGTLAGKVEIGGDADQPQLVIEGFSTQTDDIFIVQDSTDAEVFKVSNTGAVQGLSFTTTAADGRHGVNPSNSSAPEAGYMETEGDFTYNKTTDKLEVWDGTDRNKWYISNEDASEFAGVTVKSTATSYTVGTTDADESYGGVIYVTGAATITLPAVATGMNFTVITIGAVAVSVDPNASDLIYLDGTALDDGDKVTNASTTGDTAVFTYYDATGWYCTSNSWTDGGV